jgi:hypothetical protein
MSDGERSQPVAHQANEMFARPELRLVIEKNIYERHDRGCANESIVVSKPLVHEPTKSLKPPPLDSAKIRPSVAQHGLGIANSEKCLTGHVAPPVPMPGSGECVERLLNPSESSAQRILRGGGCGKQLLAREPSSTECPTRNTSVGEFPRRVVRREHDSSDCVSTQFIVRKLGADSKRVVFGRP